MLCTILINFLRDREKISHISLKGFKKKKMKCTEIDNKQTKS